MGGGTPISGWEHSADLTIYLAPIHGALTPQFVKSPLYPREGVGHDTDRCIIITVWLKIFVIIQSLYIRVLFLFSILGKIKCEFGIKYTSLLEIHSLCSPQPS